MKLIIRKKYKKSLLHSVLMLQAEFPLTKIWQSWKTIKKTPLKQRPINTLKAAHDASPNWSMQGHNCTCAENLIAYNRYNKKKLPLEFLRVYPWLECKEGRSPDPRRRGCKVSIRKPLGHLENKKISTKNEGIIAVGLTGAASSILLSVVNEDFERVNLLQS